MKKIFTLLVMLAATMGMQAQDTWTVAGEKALCGSSWDPTDTSNDMVADGSTFRLVKQNVMLTTKAWEYKVVKNHALDESYGAGEGNALLQIEEDGAYTVTFTFDPANPEPLAVAVKTGEYVKTWTVAGVGELCGSAWDPADTSNDMTSEDGVNYKWTRTELALDKATPYGFKVVADHAWDEAYGGAAGGQTSDNYEITLTEPGLYTVEITFNSDAHTIAVVTTKTGDYVFGEKTWTICGVEALCGSNWDPTDTSNDMVKTGEGEYSLTKYNVAMIADTEYEYKVAANHAWTESYGLDGGNAFVTAPADGFYDVEFVFLLDTKTLDATPSESAGINSMKVNFTKSEPIYNLQGQRVTVGFKGIGIQNGRKVIVK